MSGPVVIVIAAMPALMREPNLVGQAVAWSDPDAHDGRGDAEFTLDPLRAKRFPNAADAMKYWRRQSTIRPTRDDGKPTRPLTAFTVVVLSLAQWREALADKAARQ